MRLPLSLTVILLPRRPCAEVLVHDGAEGVDGLTLQQDVDLDQIGLLLARLLVIQAGVAAGAPDFSESKKSKMISPGGMV